MELQHGGNIYDGSLERFRREGTLLDFSANINPLGMPQAVRDALCGCADACEHYPDPLCRELTGAIAQKEGCPPEWIQCGNGAADLIFRLVLSRRPKKALVLVWQLLSRSCLA